MAEWRKWVVASIDDHASLSALLEEGIKDGHVVGARSKNKSAEEAISYQVTYDDGKDGWVHEGSLHSMVCGVTGFETMDAATAHYNEHYDDEDAPQTQASIKIAQPFLTPIHPTGRCQQWRKAQKQPEKAQW